MIGLTNVWQPWRLYGLEKWEGGGGRIQTIGDAWHAMRPFLASGGVMAIEDSAALASSLDGASSIERGLRDSATSAARVFGPWRIAPRLWAGSITARSLSTWCATWRSNPRPPPPCLSGTIGFTARRFDFFREFLKVEQPR